MNAINNNIDEKNKQEAVKPQPERQPDERGGIHVQGHLKIFDPETKEVFVNGRA